MYMNAVCRHDNCSRKGCSQLGGTRDSGAQLPSPLYAWCFLPLRPEQIKEHRSAKDESQKSARGYIERETAHKVARVNADIWKPRYGVFV